MPITSRCCCPRGLARHERYVSRITGAVPFLRRVPVGDADLLRVHVAGHNFARPTRDLSSLRHGLRSLSAGKAISDAQARML